MDFRLDLRRFVAENADLLGNYSELLIYADVPAGRFYRDNGGNFCQKFNSIEYTIIANKNSELIGKYCEDGHPEKPIQKIYTPTSLIF